MTDIASVPVGEVMARTPTPPNAETNAPVPEITITPRDNGPLIVKGRIRLVDPEGNVYDTNRRSVALCRCGASAQKPFCDGSHVKLGFRSQERAPVLQQQGLPVLEQERPP